MIGWGWKMILRIRNQIIFQPFFLYVILNFHFTRGNRAQSRAAAAEFRFGERDANSHAARIKRARWHWLAPARAVREGVALRVKLLMLEKGSPLLRTESQPVRCFVVVSGLGLCSAATLIVALYIIAFARALLSAKIYNAYIPVRDYGNEHRA